ncbi:sucA and insertion element-like 3' end domain protein [Neisseria musculi]
MSWSEMKGYPQRDAPRPADSIPARQPPDTAGKGRLKTARCLNPGRTKRGRKMPSRLRIKAGLSFETALEMMGQPHSIFRSHGCSDGAGEDSGRGTCYCLLLPTGSAFGGRPICRFETAYPCGLPATQRTLRLPQDNGGNPLCRDVGQPQDNQPSEGGVGPGRRYGGANAVHRPFERGRQRCAAILQRRFKAEKPNGKRVRAATELNNAGEKLYLSSLMDWFNKAIIGCRTRCRWEKAQLLPLTDWFNGEIIGCRTPTRPAFNLAGKMLKEALEKSRPSEKPILCSDRYGRGITKLNRANANRCKTCRARKLFGQCGRGKLLRHIKVGMFPYAQIRFRCRTGSGFARIYPLLQP